MSVNLDGFRASCDNFADWNDWELWAFMGSEGSYGLSRGNSWELIGLKPKEFWLGFWKELKD